MALDGGPESDERSDWFVTEASDSPASGCAGVRPFAYR